MDSEPAEEFSEFLPMPKEIYQEERLKNIVSLSPKEKEEAVKWLLSEGGVSLELASKYNQDGVKKVIFENMLLNGWFLPSLELANKIPLKATTEHHASSTSIPIEFETPGLPHKVDVAVKPIANPKRARHEMDNLQKLLTNGIRSAEPFALLSIEDRLGRQAFLLTLLEKGVIPLQKIHFERFNPEFHNQQLRFFLKELANFLAKVHNNGVYHNDLHLGNIGYDLTQQQKNEFVLFDLEGTNILSDQVKGRRDNLARKIVQKPKSLRQGEIEELAKFRKIEEAAVRDLSNVAADIASFNPNIDRNFLDRYFVSRYYKNRPNLQAYLPPTEFKKVFKASFRKSQERFGKFAQRRIADNSTLF